MGSRRVFVKPGRGLLSRILGVDLASFPFQRTRFLSQREYFSKTLNKTSDMARFALLCIVTLAFVASSIAVPAPQPQPIFGMMKGMMGGFGNMMGGAHKMMGQMMGGGGKMGGKMFPDIGKKISGIMERKQKMIGGIMGKKQKMIGQIMSKFSSFGGMGKKGR